MRVSFFVNQLSSKDGWGRYSVNLIKQAISSGVDCHVLASVDAKKGELSDVRVDKVLPPLFAKRSVKLFQLGQSYSQIKSLIKKADILHCLTEPYAPVVHLVKGQKPMLVTLHGTYAISPFGKKILRNVYSKVYSGADKLICVSDYTKRQILKKINSKNIIVINNGVDCSKFQRENSFDQIPKKSHIIGVGALTPRKGYHVALSALAIVKKKYPAVKYLIVGSQKNGSYYQKLREIIKKHKLENNVGFLEGISDKELIDLYYRSKLFLLTPTNVGDSFEGFGFVYLEANACGKAVVGSNNCGAEGAIKNNYNGLLVPQDNIQKTAEAVLKILDNPGLAAQMGENGKAWAKNHDWKQVFSKYLDVYKELI